MRISSESCANYRRRFRIGTDNERGVQSEAVQERLVSHYLGSERGHMIGRRDNLTFTAASLLKTHQELLCQGPSLRQQWLNCDRERQLPGRTQRVACGGRRC